MDCDKHVFVSVHVSTKIKIFDVNCHEAAAWPGDCAVEYNFGGSERSCGGADIAWVVDKVASAGKSDSVAFGFVGSFAGNKARVCRFPTGRDF